MGLLTPANFFFFAFLSARKAEEDFFLEIVYSYIRRGNILSLV